MRILIIEDNDSLVKLLKHTLEGAGHETFFASAGDDGLKKVEKLRPDLLLLDLTLPKIDGLDVSRIINSNPNKYGKPMVMIMTGKTSINDVKAGFETGAVDYIKKPFDPEEIVFKISALTKLTDKESALIVFFDLEIDQENFKIYDKENELKLTKKEYEMLIYIIKNKSQLITREKIMSSLWHKKYEKGSDRVVDIFISRLKAKVPTLKDYLHTLKGWGYILKDEKFKKEEFDQDDDKIITESI